MKNSNGIFGIDENGNEFKSRYEEAKALGIKIPEDGYWGDIPSKYCGAVGGAIGGEMVKRAIESYENKLVDKI